MTPLPASCVLQVQDGGCVCDHPSPPSETMQTLAINVIPKYKGRGAETDKQGNQRLMQTGRTSRRWAHQVSGCGSCAPCKCKREAASGFETQGPNDRQETRGGADPPGGRI